MQGEEMIRAMRQSVFEDASRKAREFAEGTGPITTEQVEERARLAATVAALNWVLGEEELPDWDFLDVVVPPRR